MKKELIKRNNNCLKDEGEDLEIIRPVHIFIPSQKVKTELVEHRQKMENLSNRVSTKNITVHAEITKWIQELSGKEMWTIKTT